MTLHMLTARLLVRLTYCGRVTMEAPRNAEQMQDRDSAKWLGVYTSLLGNVIMAARERRVSLGLEVMGIRKGRIETMKSRSLQAGVWFGRMPELGASRRLNEKLAQGNGSHNSGLQPGDGYKPWVGADDRS